MVAWKQIYVHVIDYNTSMAAPKQMQSTDYKYSITIFALKQNDTDSWYWLQHHYASQKTDTDSCCCLQVEHDHECLKTEWYGFLLQTTRPIQPPEIHLPVTDHHHEPQNCYSYINKQQKNIIQILTTMRSRIHMLPNHHRQKDKLDKWYCCVFTHSFSPSLQIPPHPPALTTNMAD